MSNIFYIGNLPYSMTPPELANILKATGHIGAIKIITDRETGLSKGYGFIKMTTEKEAHEAMEKLKCLSLNGSPVHIKKVIQEPARRSLERNASQGRIRCYRNDTSSSDLRFS
jgi:RNA recognition motif-containing protein